MLRSVSSIISHLHGHPDTCDVLCGSESAGNAAVLKPNSGRTSRISYNGKKDKTNEGLWDPKINRKFLNRADHCG